MNRISQNGHQTCSVSIEGSRATEVDEDADSDGGTEEEEEESKKILINLLRTGGEGGGNELSCLPPSSGILTANKQGAEKRKSERLVNITARTFLVGAAWPPYPPGGGGGGVLGTMTARTFQRGSLLEYLGPPSPGGGGGGGTRESASAGSSSGSSTSPALGGGGGAEKGSRLIPPYADVKTDASGQFEIVIEGENAHFFSVEPSKGSLAVGTQQIVKFFFHPNASTGQIACALCARRPVRTRSPVDAHPHQVWYVSEEERGAWGGEGKRRGLRGGGGGGAMHVDFAVSV